MTPPVLGSQTPYTLLNTTKILQNITKTLYKSSIIGASAVSAHRCGGSPALPLRHAPDAEHYRPRHGERSRLQLLLKLAGIENMSVLAVNHNNVLAVNALAVPLY